MSGHGPPLARTARPPRSALSPFDQLGERGFVAEQARIQRQLSAVILFVRNTVMHPGQSQRGHSIELTHKLQHPDLTDLRDRRSSLIVTVSQRLDCVRLVSGLIPRLGVLGEQFGIRLTREISVLPGQLTAHQPAGFDDVVGQLERAPLKSLWPLLEASLRQVLDLGNYAIARVAPGFQEFIEYGQLRLL